MKLTGGLISGDVQLQLPKAFVAKLTAVLLGPKRASVTDEDAADIDRRALQHAGGAHRCEPHCSRLLQHFEHPHIARGRRLEFENAPGAKTCRSDWTCEGHLLKVASQFSFRSR